MAWTDRRTPRSLLSGWEQQRRAQRVIARDGGICHVCHRPGADQADHVVSLLDDGRDDETNMAAIHAHPCHTDKSRAEAARARKASRPSRLRPPEPHPGLIKR